jgi:hypothetical protein
MTPSINRLAYHSKALGEYILSSEWDLVEEEFVDGGITSLEQFRSWVTGYMYYNALVCVCGGNEQDINTQLEADYEELQALVGADVVVTQ